MISIAYDIGSGPDLNIWKVKNVGPFQRNYQN